MMLRKRFESMLRIVQWEPFRQRRLSHRCVRASRVVSRKVRRDTVYRLAKRRAVRTTPLNDSDRSKFLNFLNFIEFGGTFRSRRSIQREIMNVTINCSRETSAVIATEKRGFVSEETKRR